MLNKIAMFFKVAGAALCAIGATCDAIVSGKELCKSTKTKNND